VSVFAALFWPDGDLQWPLRSLKIAVRNRGVCAAEAAGGEPQAPGSRALPVRSSGRKRKRKRKRERIGDARANGNTRRTAAASAAQTPRFRRTIFSGRGGR
jgi:hypothetical protein